MQINILPSVGKVAQMGLPVTVATCVDVKDGSVPWFLGNGPVVDGAAGNDGPSLPLNRNPRSRGIKRLLAIVL